MFKSMYAKQLTRPSAASAERSALTPEVYNRHCAASGLRRSAKYIAQGASSGCLRIEMQVFFISLTYEMMVGFHCGRMLAIFPKDPFFFFLWLCS